LPPLRREQEAPKEDEKLIKIVKKLAEIIVQVEMDCFFATQRSGSLHDLTASAA
jgi:hypothetical protein